MILMLSLLDGQICTDSVNIQLDGNDQIGTDRIAVVPRLNFTCNGRITNIRAKMGRNSFVWQLPYFQIWQPMLPTSVIYNRIHAVQLQFAHVTQLSNFRASINITLTGDERIEFQSGDVIGYYHPSDSRYEVRTVRTDGYIQYELNGSSTLTSVNLNTVSSDDVTNQRQPLIQFTIG